ncbi:MAG TPA: LacI family transcriptional regulator [Candidatus Limosilactobacillus merdigallinarum]|uniref:LacI family transcriptional regulator n=1 Tax=Candidatus Limosilactobacillus merdigallinarum TaxID=2838652 RepID=A0A9D1VHH1_9LACO|nr:LacI family transcriptional regulator [Candidatus Limosilactobacillus merdigallinarum]
MVTIKDIAKKAGVSASTASRALNNNSRISEKTRRHVKDVAKQLGYKPNFSAQNLTRGRANIVGVIFPIIKTDAPANPFHIDIIRGISEELQKHNFEMMVAITQERSDLLKQVKSMVDQIKVDYFVLLYSDPTDPITKYLRDHKLRFTIVGQPIENGDRFVDNDNVKVGRKATEYLLSSRNIQQPIFVMSDEQKSFEKSRFKGYAEVMTKRELLSEKLLVNDQVSITQYLKKNPQVDGLIFADDVLYIRHAQRLRPLNIPVICFNNSQWMQILFQDGQVIDLQPRKLGQAAVQILFSKHTDHIYVPYLFA